MSQLPHDKTTLCGGRRIGSRPWRQVSEKRTALLLRGADNGGEDGLRRVLAGEAGLAAAGAIVDNNGGLGHGCSLGRHRRTRLPLPPVHAVTKGPTLAHATQARPAGDALGSMRVVARRAGPHRRGRCHAGGAPRIIASPANHTASRPFRPVRSPRAAHTCGARGTWAPGSPLSHAPAQFLVPGRRAARGIATTGIRPETAFLACTYLTHPADELGHRGQSLYTLYSTHHCTHNNNVTHGVLAMRSCTRTHSDSALVCAPADRRLAHTVHSRANTCFCECLSETSKTLGPPTRTVR